jgi:hypothetical protein
MMKRNNKATRATVEKTRAIETAGKRKGKRKKKKEGETRRKLCSIWQPANLFYLLTLLTLITGFVYLSLEQTARMVQAQDVPSSRDPDQIRGDKRTQFSRLSVEKKREAYEKIARNARERGYNQAARHLEKWLAGEGGYEQVPAEWLTGQQRFQQAEKRNQQRFIDTLVKKAEQARPGESTSLNDYWDTLVSGNVRDDELKFASGNSTLTTGGLFSLVCDDGAKVTIKGVLRNRWRDTYDWEGPAGLSVSLPQVGMVSDSDALEVERKYGAKPFEMSSVYERDFTMVYDKKTKKYSVTYSNPREVNTKKYGPGY